MLLHPGTEDDLPRPPIRSDTYHPLEAVEASHLGGGVDRRHAVPGAGAQTARLVVDQVAQHVEVALLRRQVHRRHVVLHAGVGAEEETGKRGLRFFNIDISTKIGYLSKIQGGPLGCTLPFVDIITKVPSQFSL